MDEKSNVEVTSHTPLWFLMQINQFITFIGLMIVSVFFMYNSTVQYNFMIVINSVLVFKHSTSCCIVFGNYLDGLMRLQSLPGRLLDELQ